jgi:urea transport system substrate-binding protein
LQYEGLEQSPNLVYMGAAPNQQIIPGARWTLDHLGDRLYLIGTDYIFPRTANQLIRDLVNAADGEILAERYVPFDATDFGAIAAEIARLAPDAVLNTLNGASNRDFFRALSEAGLDAVPVVSFSVAEPELTTTLADHPHPNHFAVWGYFQTLSTEDNRRFVEAFKARFGQNRVVSDPVVSSYEAVMLWAEAVRNVRTDDPGRVNPAIDRVSVPGPSGIVVTDAATRHRWRRVYIGRARADGQFDATEISETPVRPVPFPLQRSRSEWLGLVERLAAADESPHLARPEDAP